MSLRPGLRAVLARSARSGAPARAFGSSAPRRAAHQDTSSEADTNETFLNTTWINTFVLVGLAFAGYKLLPAPSAGPASPTTNNEALTAQKDDGKVPLVTRYLASRLEGTAGVNDERSDKHLELSVEAADTRLLFQEAEQPKVWRMTYPSSFDQASPNCIGVGTQISLQDLKVKSDVQ